MSEVPNQNQVVEGNINPESCRALWCAVIMVQWNLVFKPCRVDWQYERPAALRWFDSAAFEQVCSLAGFDPDWLREEFQARLLDFKQVAP